MENGGGRGDDRNRILSPDGIAFTLTATIYKEPIRIMEKKAIPVCTPMRGIKQQHGRRMKEDGEDMFTVTVGDVHGVGVNTTENVDTIYYEKEDCDIAIRKLTPKECFRLQGWTDDYFEKAQFVNSDSQLYKQAGNGVTVTVIEAIGRKLNDTFD